jgi:hypothetical protein
MGRDMTDREYSPAHAENRVLTEPVTKAEQSARIMSVEITKIKLPEKIAAMRPVEEERSDIVIKSTPEMCEPKENIVKAPAATQQP